jgi:hypothetical protein
VEISDEVAPVKKMYVLYSSGLAWVRWLGIVWSFAILKSVRPNDYFKGGQVNKYCYLFEH